MPSAEEYYFYKKNHVCVRCNREDAAKGKTMCLYCLSKDAEKARRYRATHTSTEAKKRKQELDKKRYYQRKAEGMCVQCGERPARNGCARCERCIAYINRHTTQSRRKKGIKPFYMRTEYDVCYMCGKPPIEGKRLCPDCKERAMIGLKIAWSKADNTKHIWRKQW